MTAKIKKIVKEVIEDIEFRRRVKRRKRIRTLGRLSVGLLLYFAPVIILIAWLIYHNIELASTNIDDLVFMMWVWGMIVFFLGMYCGEQDC